MKKRFFCLFLSLVLLLCISPAASAQTASVTIRGLHDAQVHHAALYAMQDGTPAGRDLLADCTMEPVDYEKEYRLTLACGDYQLNGYDSAGYLNGSLQFTVVAGENLFHVQRVYDLHAANSGWIEGDDYRIDAQITAPDGTQRTFAFGQADNYGTLRTSCLFLKGDTIDVSFTPIGSKADVYLPVRVSKTPGINCAVTCTIYEGLTVAFTAPEGSTVSAGTFSDYYVYHFFDPLETGAPEDGRIRTQYRIPKMRAGNTSGTNFFYRVQHPDGVTYWNYFDPAALTNPEIEISADQLFLGNAVYNAHTVYRNFEHNAYDRADLYLSGNKQGYIPLRTGETFELNAFRNWMAIESIYNAKVALPDMHYTVVDMQGNPSDVLRVTLDAHNSSIAAVHANHAGTALVLVTYDAMYSEQAYVSGAAGKPCAFSAIWPENTGVLVFSVDADGSAIQTGMMLNGTGAGNEIDAEHDPLFYFGTDGASYTFTPEAGCTVSVNRSAVSDHMTFGGFSTDGVQYNTDGSVRVDGLTTGKHILRVEKDGLATYQVLSARQISANTPDTAPRAGDTVHISFSGLVNPVEKMSGIYNNSARIRYIGSDKTAIYSPLGGKYGVYDFSSSQPQQSLTFTLPRYFAGETYTLSDGAIAMNLSGSAPGSHRGVSYRKGVDPGFNAQSSGALQGSLPNITIPLQKTDYLTGTLHLTDTNGRDVSCGDVQIVLTDADGYETAVQPDGAFLCLPGEYAYQIDGEAIEHAQGSFLVTESGSFTIEVQRTHTPGKLEQFFAKLSAFFAGTWRVLSKPFRMLIDWICSLLHDE